MCPHFWPLLPFDIQFYTGADVSPFLNTISLWHSVLITGWCVPIILDTFDILAFDIQFYTEADLFPFLAIFHILAFDIQFYTEADDRCVPIFWPLLAFDNQSCT